MRSVIISIVIPSAMASSSASTLTLANGNTAIVGFSGSGDTAVPVISSLSIGNNLSVTNVY